MTLSNSLTKTVVTVLLAGIASGQYASETIAPNFKDISSTGTLVLDTGDDESDLALLGFTFDFYGTALTGLQASSNGYLAASSAGLATSWDNQCLPDTGELGGVIAPHWDDLAMDDHGDIFVETAGTAGSQVATIQWENIGGFFNTGASYNFQVKLFEGSNDIEFHYNGINGGFNPSNGSEATVGIQNIAADSAVEISCDAAVSFATAYRFYIPAIAEAAHTAPAVVCIGDTVTFSGSGEPGHFFAIAVSASNGPTGPLDLGADYVNNIIGTGIIDAMGSTGDITISVPASITCGSIGYSQMVTIGGFAPISGVSISTSVGTVLNSCQTFLGTLDTDDLTSDHYDFTGTAGDVLTISLCRIGDQMDGSSLLDPRLCVYDAGTTIGSSQGIADDDDDNGDCFATGPFGASIIEDWMVPATADYTITASAWDGTEGPYELAVMGCTGTVTLNGDEVAGGCFN